MCTISKVLFLNTIFLVCVINTNNCKVCAQNIDEKDKDFNVWVDELYSLYKDSFENGKLYQTRRFHVNGKSYALHVKKLKEVNGLKTHNLKVESRSLRSGSIVYIDNPVEAALPNAYLTLNEFRATMLKKAQDNKKEFNQKRKDFINIHKQLEKLKKAVRNFKHKARATKNAFFIHTTKLPKGFKKVMKRSKIGLVHNKLRKKAEKQHPAKLTIAKMSTKPMTTIKKIKKAIKKMKQVVNLTTELATVKTTREFTTTPQAVSLTASTVTNATVQNKHENVTTEISEIKTTIMEQNVTDEKLVTTPVTEKPETETPTVSEFTTASEITTVSEITTFSEITTVTEPSTTTTTVKTARTRQARPFVFMGGS